jgi:hypothetical protein
MSQPRRIDSTTRWAPPWVEHVQPCLPTGSFGSFSGFGGVATEATLGAGLKSQRMEQAGG